MPQVLAEYHRPGEARLPGGLYGRGTADQSAAPRLPRLPWHRACIRSAGRGGRRGRVHIQQRRPVAMRGVRRDGGVVAMSDQPLRVEVTSDGELIIRIGINTLAFAMNTMEQNNPYDEDAEGYRRLWKVTDPAQFAKEVRIELCREEEDGSTPLSDLLDTVCWNAIEAGCFGVDEDGDVDPYDDRH